jgi:thioredoxin
MVNRLFLLSILYSTLSLATLAAVPLSTLGIRPLSDFLHNKSAQKAFSELIAGKKPVVVKFSAPWCPPCKKMAPIVHQIAQQFSSKALFVETDIDKYELLANKYIQSIPTIIVFKEGKELLRINGAKSAIELTTLLNTVIK